MLRNSSVVNETIPRLLPVIVVLAAALAFLSPRFGAEPLRGQPDLAAAAVADEVLVQLSPGAIEWPDAVLEKRLGGSVTARFRDVGFVRLGLRDGEGTAEAVQRLARLPFVRLVEPNLRVQSTANPNDPFFTAQSDYLSLIEAQAAWQVQQGEASVVVAVLDSGVHVDHPDLAGKVWLNVLETANGLDDDANGCIDDLRGCNFVSPGSADPGCPASGGQHVVEDDNGHGTFVAGVIGARGNNGIGIIGAAPNVTILPVKILDCLGGGNAADAAQGILYAARAGARVANISFAASGESALLAQVIREAHERYGMVIVAATGNRGGNTVSFPARLPEPIAVGSSGTPSDPLARSPFSDWGPQVAVAAPGLNIVSTVPQSFCGIGWLCVQDGPYALASGTSFAAPLVSALAALIISHNPNISPQEVLRIMQQTAEPMPEGDTPGWAGAGRIRMRAALEVKRFYIGAPGVSRN
jgi:thermitase